MKSQKWSICHIAYHLEAVWGERDGAGNCVALTTPLLKDGQQPVLLRHRFQGFVGRGFHWLVLKYPYVNPSLRTNGVILLVRCLVDSMVIFQSMVGLSINYGYRTNTFCIYYYILVANIKH
jgi:hypothetical protein